MLYDNLTKLIDANATLIQTAKVKGRIMVSLRDQINEFGFIDPENPTQAELDSLENQKNIGLARLEMADLQDNFNSEKSIFLNPEVIPDPPID